MVNAGQSSVPEARGNIKLSDLWDRQTLLNMTIFCRVFSNLGFAPNYHWLSLIFVTEFYYSLKTRIEQILLEMLLEQWKRFLTSLQRELEDMLT